MPNAAAFRMHAQVCRYLAGRAAELWVVVALTELAEEFQRRANRTLKSDAAGRRQARVQRRSIRDKR